MNDDQPPPYTAVDDTKINQLTAGQLPGPGNFNLQQQPLLPGYPTAPPGYETAAYYPAPAAAASSVGGASVFQQPQQQQQATITDQVNCPVNQVVQPDAEEAKGSRATDFCCLCCMCTLCCCCPCFLVSFM